MIYVASPYSNNFVGEAKRQAEDARYKRVLQFVTFIMLTRGPAAFSPIVYCHPIVRANTKLGTDAAYWMTFNMSFLRRAEAVFVLMLPGWDVSVGVKAELKIADLLHIPVFYYDEQFQEVTKQ